MASKTQNKESIGTRLKAHFSRNLGWLANEIGMSQGQLSKKIHETKPWKKEDIDKINKVLGTNFKL